MVKVFKQEMLQVKAMKAMLDILITEELCHSYCGCSDSTHCDVNKRALRNL